MYTIEQLRTWIGAHEFIYPKYRTTISAVAVDSRHIKEGALFFALAGESANSRNGHQFLFEAVARGANLVCIQKDYVGPLPPGVGIFKVGDCLKSLQRIAQGYLVHCGAEVIAITGSVGKTTTTQLFAQIASPHVSLSHTLGSQNGRIGVPLSLLNNLTPHHKWIALEMGMDRSGQIAQLVEIAPPTFAAITAIECVHMENFQTLRELARAKGEILFSPKLKSALINTDSHCHRQLARTGGCSKIFLSSRSNPKFGYGAQLLENRLTVTENGQVVLCREYPTMLGSQHLSCLLSAVVLARQIHLSYDQIADGWTLLKPPQGRFSIYRTQSFTLIDDTYNASPVSVMASLSALPRPTDDGKCWAVLAPMEELGHWSQKAHMEVGRSAFRNLDGLICLRPMDALIAGQWPPNRKPLWPASGLDEILHILLREMGPSDVLLIKGSRKWRLEKLIDPLLKNFGALSSDSFRNK